MARTVDSVGVALDTGIALDPARRLRACSNLVQSTKGMRHRLSGRYLRIEKLS